MEENVIGRTVRREKISDGKYERQIITGMIVSDEFCKAIIPILKNHPKILRLSKLYGRIIKEIINYWDKYDRAPVKYTENICYVSI